MLVLVVTIAVAAQVDPPPVDATPPVQAPSTESAPTPAPQPVVALESRTRTFANVHAVEQGCGYNDDSDEWLCAGDALDKQVTVATSTGSAPASVAVDIVPIVEDECVRGVEVTATPRRGGLEVDWEQVAFVVDGAARPAVPGFARLDTANLVQRRSVVPAGARLHEAVWEVDGRCLVSTHGPSDLRLEVPVVVDGVPAAISWRRTASWQAGNERGAFAILGEDSDAWGPSWWGPVFAGAGTLAGALVGAAAGLAGYSVATNGTANAVNCGLFCGALFGVPAIAALAVIGTIVDIGICANAGVVREREALERKRAELGLDGSTQAQAY